MSYRALFRQIIALKELAVQRVPWAKIRRFILGHQDIEQTHAPEATRRLSIINTVLIFIGVCGGLWLYDEAAYCFREGRLMTWVSFFQLLTIGYVAQKIWVLREPDREFAWHKPAAIWRILAVGFIFMAFDELFKLHENFDRTLHKVLRVEETWWSDMLDDFIIFLYGVAGFAALVRYRHELKNFSSAWRYLLVGALCCIATVGFDFASGAKHIYRMYLESKAQVDALAHGLGLVEEIFKMYAEVFLIGAVIHSYTALSQTAETSYREAA